jgi:hypothetical protein
MVETECKAETNTEPWVVARKLLIALRLPRGPVAVPSSHRRVAGRAASGVSDSRSAVRWECPRAHTCTPPCAPSANPSRSEASWSITNQCCGLRVDHHRGAGPTPHAGGNPRRWASMARWPGGVVRQTPRSGVWGKRLTNSSGDRCRQPATLPPGCRLKPANVTASRGSPFSQPTPAASRRSSESSAGSGKSPPSARRQSH